MWCRELDLFDALGYREDFHTLGSERHTSGVALSITLRRRWKRTLFVPVVIVVAVAGAVVVRLMVFYGLRMTTE